MKPRISAHCSSRRRTCRTPEPVRAPHVATATFGRRGVLLVLGGAAVFGFLALYVGVVNAAAVRGNDIRELERRIAQLDDRRNALALEEAQLRAFDASRLDQTRYEPINAQETITLAAGDHGSLAMR